jgi:tRNA nucleotidyltransferase (CCA-adding enzyme)
LIDNFGGQNDLKNKIIRAVGDPETRFCEDALRILRAFRFAAQLEFEIEENTLLAAQKCAYLLKNIARERISAELKRLLASRGAAYSLQKMTECGVWNELFENCAPSNKKIDLLNLVSSGNFVTRLAILLEDYEESEIEDFLISLRLSNDEKKKVLRLCKVKNFQIQNENHTKWARHFLHLYDNILLDALDVLSVRLTKDEFESFKTVVFSEQKQRRPLRISDLTVNGDDLLPLCKGNRALVGKALSSLLDLVIDSPELNQKEILLELAKRMM